MHARIAATTLAVTAVVGLGAGPAGAAPSLTAPLDSVPILAGTVNANCAYSGTVSLVGVAVASGAVATSTTIICKSYISTVVVDVAQNTTQTNVAVAVKAVAVHGTTLCTEAIVQWTAGGTTHYGPVCVPS
jgi:hypothetical protein